MKYIHNVNQRKMFYPGSDFTKKKWTTKIDRKSRAI